MVEKKISLTINHKEKVSTESPFPQSARPNEIWVEGKTQFTSFMVKKYRL